MQRLESSLNRRGLSGISILAGGLILFTSFALTAALYFDTAGLFERLQMPKTVFWWLTVLAIVGLLSLGAWRKTYHSFHLSDLNYIAKASFFLSFTCMSLSFLVQLPTPRLLPILFGFVCFGSALIFRLSGVMFGRVFKRMQKTKERVLIYGAGAAGLQLVSALKQSPDAKPIAFIDDNKLTHNQTLSGLPVQASEELETIVELKKIDKIVLAIPSLPLDKKARIITRLKRLNCAVQVMPPNIDLIRKSNILNSLVTVDANNALGDSKTGVSADTLKESYKGKSVLISGAGGSIGRELCRQILKCAPAKLIMYEQSEFALYEAERELKGFANRMGAQLLPILGDVCDAVQLKHVFDTVKVQVVFHAAAYKHVPLVELNEVSGIKNNVLGSYLIAKQALRSNIETFVLISSDKAVRPTNVMGAAKRLAELVVQDFNKRSSKTTFSMVRFGNVMGSSGSVIPLFKEQIAKGGPITLTHDDVTRYFMAIPEAAELVISAGCLASGGEVFVLNMGSPIKIKDLARNMIEKNNLTVRDEDNPEGDIEIVTIGLRPGEKLFEELLIDYGNIKSRHPKIMLSVEKSLKSREVQSILKNIEQAVSNNDAQHVRRILQKWVEGYKIPAAGLNSDQGDLIQGDLIEDPANIVSFESGDDSNVLNHSHSFRLKDEQNQP